MVQGPVTYCDDTVATDVPSLLPPRPGGTYLEEPVDMATNFRTYMSHLSQLSPDQDGSRQPLYSPSAGPSRMGTGNMVETWPDVDMYSSDSDGEEYLCSRPQRRPHVHGESRICSIHGHGHARRNPHFPYESFGTPRVAWGETPREAWSEHADEHLYDSANRYALFNLPKSRQRGKRKQNSGEVCTCSVRPREQPCAVNAETGIPRAQGFCEGPTSPLPMEDRVSCKYKDDRAFVSSHESAAESGSSSGLMGSSGGLAHSRSLPIFSSQESMDTTSETGESSDTDADPMSVSRGTLSANVSSAAASSCSNTSRCSKCRSGCVHQGADSVYSKQHKAHGSVSRNHEHSGVVRPKAIKLESGRRYKTRDACYCDRENANTGRAATGCCKHSQRHYPTSAGSGNTRAKHTGVRTIPDQHLELPGLDLETPDETRTVTLGSHRHSDTSTSSPASRKSLKDIHNSVIKQRLFSQPSRTEQIDLTGGDADVGHHGDESGTVSPVMPEVHLPSDDSDIEVVKIDRYKNI